MSSLLCSRHDDDVFAFNVARTPLFEQPLGAVSVGQAMGLAEQIAEQLPSSDWVINLCENRFAFTLGFCAAIWRGQCNLLPQNAAQETINGLLQRYPKAVILHDGGQAAAAYPQAVDTSKVNLIPNQRAVAPEILPEQKCAIAFTSGSTGSPKANLKTWRILRDSSLSNARHMMLSDHSHLLATVPAQHMWGLETSVLLSLFSNVSVYDAKPFFPKDIVAELERMPRPRVLVSTPVHLRALLKSGLALPVVDRVLCATAPLPQDLAEEIERTMSAELVEIYGCSEVGSMAFRNTAKTNEWQLFDALSLSASGDSIRADYLPEELPFQDCIQRRDGNRFVLLGRNDDMLQIAGKRGSLQEMNRILLMMDGVQDGAVFMPEEEGHEVNRPVAFVVADKSVSRAAVQRHFGRHLDSVFIPRPVLFVDALPREGSGKLRRASLQNIWRTMTST